MIRNRSLLLFVFLLLFALLHAPMFVLAQEGTEPPIEVTDVVAPVTPAPDAGEEDAPVVVVTSPGIGPDWSLLLTLIAVAVVGVIVYFRTRDLTLAGGSVLDALETSYVGELIEDRINRMRPENRLNLLKLVEVLDPLTDFTPFELDDRAVLWLQGLLESTANTEDRVKAIVRGAFEQYNSALTDAIRKPDTD